MKPADSTQVELDSLIRLFYDECAQLGRFESVTADRIPEPSRSLLDHSRHMTVTVEKYHGGPVDVKVLRTKNDGDHYAREILLTKQSDQRVVQYGIVRLNMSLLSEVVSSEIESQGTPLGRILIRHDVLRTVKLEQLFRIECGDLLAGSLDVKPGTVVFGRTAMIYCDGQAAIELLEIVRAA